MASCYHPDGFDDHNSFRGSGAEFARWVVTVLPHFAATMHFLGSPLIRTDGGVAQVDTYCVAHHLTDETDMILGLRYVDRFERRDGRWLIAQARLRIRLDVHGADRPRRARAGRSPRTSPSAQGTRRTSRTEASEDRHPHRNMGLRPCGRAAQPHQGSCPFGLR